MSNKTQHTPGPWEDSGHDGDDCLVYSLWGNIARVYYDGDYKQRDANARLIAAAPDMLEVAEKCKSFLTDPQITKWINRSGYKSNEYGSVVIALLEVIAKATGKEQP